MKKTAVTIIVLFATCVIALICILYFRGNGQDKDAPTFEEVTDTNGMDTGIPIRDREPDEASGDLAEHLTEYLDHEVDARYVVSTGDTIRNLPFAYTVDSWQLTKQNPGDYQLNEYPEVEYDENKNILNDYSYVVADITVENLQDREVTQHIWGFIRLQMRGAEKSCNGEVSNIVNLETNELKPITKNTYEETFAANEIRKERLIYVVPDDLLPYCDGFYLRIEHMGGSDSTLNKLDAEVRRWIILN
ncbi:MAG TPA: hypothetical protein H9981_04740 [Candidatus Mediterraneibacter caccavium]|uniref:DUF4352 domain-containing protein n=1 Tax=Candidatus Mediterraneibacter caccavium TaxID=2838661 RepID=A0A9D1VX07_9FIRM|nr:hypothetical protein [Candidatus Mediterraneibacter caccavium]